MKKLALLFLAILALCIAAVYYLIPDTLVVTEFVKVKCVSDAAFRSLSNEQSWNKWWPHTAGASTDTATGKFIRFGQTNYTLSKKVTNNFEILIETKKGIIASQMNLFSIPNDSTLIKWQFSKPAGSSFFKRITAYTEALSLKKEMRNILDHLQPYLSDFKNVYGFSYRETSTNDSLLITTKSFSPAYPATGFVYGLINKLQRFSSAQGITVTGTPMLNVSPLNPSGYQVMLALPVNRPAQEKDSVTMVKMIRGKFIVADVTGGVQTVRQVHQQIRYFFQDYRKTSMAIPFEYLLTDRQAESDTSKWLTRIYAPVY